MFAYCLNNPVMYRDPSGYGVFDDLLDYFAWCGNIYNQQQALDTQIRMQQNEIIGNGLRSAYNAYNDSIIRQQKIENEITRAQLDVIGNGASALWDACMRGCQIQQEAQRLEAELMLDGIKTAYNFLDETEVIDVGMTSYHSYQAARSFKKAMAYYIAPIPTIIDEGIAVGYMVKGLYHLCKGFKEVIN